MEQGTVLESVIASVRHRGQRKLAAALTVCDRQARLFAPTNGLLASPEDDQIVDRIARDFFGLGAAEGELRLALRAVPDFGRRDAIETALSRVLAARDDAHYYFGFAMAGAAAAGAGRAKPRRRKVQGGT